MAKFSRRGLHGQLADTIGRRILSGELAEGQILDVEKFESDFNVSRTVVREATKVLSAKGLLDARPRVGTYVLPRASWNLLDSDVMVWRAESGFTNELLAELDQLRRMIEPSAVRIAALNRTADDLALIQAALDRMSDAHHNRSTTHGSSLAEHVEADIEFHTALLRATGNELIAHLDVMLQPVLNFRASLVPKGEQSEQFLDAHAEVFRAVADSDPDRAEKAMNALLEAAAGDVRRLLNRSPQ